MRKIETIEVDERVLDKVPAVIRDLPEALYRLTKLGTVENPKHGPSEIREGLGYIGHLRVSNRGGGPALNIGNFPWGGLLTSWIVEARTVSQDVIEIRTENSRYKLEGPLPDSVPTDEDVQEAA